MSAAEYEYACDHGVLFVRELPKAELAYRKQPVNGTTWAHKSITTQVDALIRYGRLATDAGKKIQWLDEAIGIFQYFLQTLRFDLAFPDEGPALRQGQRIVTAAGKIGYSYLRTPTFQTYLDFAEAPFSSGSKPRVDWLGDRMFAHLRLAGMNPNLVTRAVDLAEVEACAELSVVQQGLDEPIERALEQRRLFVVGPDAFALLRDIASASDYEHPHRRRFICAPTAVFVRDEASRHLRPLAIRCGDARRFCAIPAGATQFWARAKIHYAVAEGTYQTYVSHQPQTHFLMEAIAIATRRAFAGFDNHPVAAFLEPHIEGVMAVNAISRQTLLAVDSPFSEFIALDPVTTWSLVEKVYDARRQNVAPLPVPELGDEVCYPFGEDHRRLDRCVRDWAKAFVRAHYGDADPLDDDGVRAWAAELEVGAGLTIPPLVSAAALAEVLGRIACIATVQHAAVHFPQSDLGRCAAIAPLYAADAPPGARASEGSELSGLPALHSLPDVHAAAWQAFVLNEADVHWRPLTMLTAHESIGRVSNPDVEKAKAAFNAELELATAAIRARNETLVGDCLRPYHYLLPDQVICSPNT